MAKKETQELDKQARVRLTFTGNIETLKPITADAYDRGAVEVIFERVEGADLGRLTVVFEGKANHVVSIVYDMNRHAQ
jgi:hypothetical protein